MEAILLFLTPLFILGGLANIAFLITSFIILIALVENDNDFVPMIGVGLIVWGIFTLNPALAIPSIGTILVFIAAYFALGAAWSVGKWFFFIREFAAKIRTYRVEYDKGDKQISFEAYLRHYSTLIKGNKSIVPKATDNLSRLRRWIIWWPTSLVWTLINDPIRKIANEILNRLEGIYNSISKSLFKDINLD